MEINKKLVSIIMPTYNANKYIKEAVDSIIKQTYNNWELLIVDDASTDSTQQIITEYINKDDRIKLIKGKKQGIGGALNLGISIAKGDYIARMDADDISLPLRLEKQIQFMERHSDIGVCATQYYCFTYNNVQKKNMCKLFTDQDIKAGMIFSDVIGHPTVMFRKKVFDEGWRYKENIIAEDYDLWTRMIPDVNFACLEEVLLYYRMENQNLTLSISLDKITNVANQIIRACIMRLFQIEPSYYCDEIYGTYNRYYKTIDICEYLGNQLELLQQIYEKNQKHQVLEFDALRKSLHEKWRSTIDFLYISDNILMANDALFVKNLDALFQGIKRVNEYKCKLEEIREYFREIVRSFDKIVIYGTGKMGTVLFERYLELKEQKKINCKLDVLIDKKVQSIIVNGREYAVNTLQYLEQTKSDIILITTVKYYEEIKRELIDIGIDSKNIMSGNILWFI